MPREEPLFRKCCHCIPLQSCLQIWATVKVLADISISLFLTFMVMVLARHELRSNQFTSAHAFVIIIIMLFVDGCFMVLLSVGLCRKDVQSLRVFYYYSLYMSVSCALFVLGLCAYEILQAHVQLMIIAGTCGLIVAALDVAIILTLKSEIIKLRNKQQFEFVNLRLKGEDDQSEIEEVQLNA